MKFALLHLALLDGPVSENLKKLAKATEIAAAAKAELVITPEMAVQGYRMRCTGNKITLLELNQSPCEAENYAKYLKKSNTSSSKERILALRKRYGLTEEDYHVSEGMPIGVLAREEGLVNSDLIAPLQELSRKYKLPIIVGCGTAFEGKPHNSAIVLDTNGNIAYFHHKLKIMRGETEGWAACSNNIGLAAIGNTKVGLLVCSDTWYEENGEIYGSLGAELMITIAAWPDAGCGGPPPEAWKRCCRASGGVPLIVCNQTGRFFMDCSEAESALLEKGEIICSYKGEEAILIGEYDEAEKCIVSKTFKILPFR